jgi:hypothetical protein
MVVSRDTIWAIVGGWAWLGGEMSESGSFFGERVGVAYILGWFRRRSFGRVVMLELGVGDSGGWCWKFGQGEKL